MEQKAGEESTHCLKKMVLISSVLMRDGVFLDGWISRTLLCVKVMTNTVCPSSILFTEAVKYTPCTNTTTVRMQDMNDEKDLCLIKYGVNEQHFKRCLEAMQPSAHVYKPV